MSMSWRYVGRDHWACTVGDGVWDLHRTEDGWHVGAPGLRGDRVICGSAYTTDRAKGLAELWIADAAHGEPATVEWCWVLTRRNFTDVYTDSGVLTASKGAKRSEILAALVSEAEEKSGVTGLAIEFLYLEREETT